MNRVARGVLLCAGLLALSAGPAHAQAIGQIFGKVTDPSGASLPGVTVTVNGPTLQTPLVTTTQESGAYQFPSVPVGTYTVSFELSSFKKASRPGVQVTSGFNAQIDQRLEIGSVSEEMTVSAASPVVDTKKTTTGATFTKDVLENIPTARDPWQVINMTPGVQLNAANVGGSRSGQQLTPTVYGSSANVQWNLEGGMVTDLASNASSSYYNFDSFEQIQVTTGGGDVSVQSAGLSINLVTKSGSNVFKGSATTTFSNDKLQFSNVSEALFTQGSSGFLSGNPINKIANYSVEYGGPIKKNRLWWWAAASRQDINAGVLNFFDPNAGTLCNNLVTAQSAGQALGITYNQLGDVQNCLQNDRTLIVDYEWKANFQLNASHKFQFLFTSDNKFRNARGASATTTIDAVNEQTAPAPWGLPYATPVLTHTWIATDKLVFNNMFTYVNGGFNQDYQGSYTEGKCGGLTEYIGNTDYNDYLTGDRANPDCLFNRQSLLNRTTGLNSRTLNSTFQNVVPTWEAKTDGTYFTSNRFGGDHSLKFGLGWRRAPQMTYSHYSGGARAQQQCIGNNRANCGGGVTVPAGSAAGFTAYQAILYRDTLRNNDWWSYNGYLQDSYSRGRLRINGGIRYDWQRSTYRGGCVPNNPIRPDLLPAQCEEATDVDPINGRRLQSFSNWSPRVSVIYDLTGSGKTSVRASYSYYFATKLVLANALGGLFTQPALTWGNNNSNGTCATNTPCWQDTNLDSIIQADELIGTPTTSQTRFNLATGIFSPTGNIVDPSAKLGRTREFITGVQHELIPNLALGVEYVYRKYDRGTTTYSVGFEPRGTNVPISSLYTGPFFYTDPTTGVQAPYYQICDTCTRPSGLAQITMTNPNYQVYSGVSATVTKRLSNKWQLNGSATWQTNPQYTTAFGFTDPQGVEFNDGFSTLARYLVKINGSYQLPWGFMAAANFNVQDGANRQLTINGPGNVPGGVTPAGCTPGVNCTAQSTISRSTITFQPNGSTHLEANKLLDVGVTKAFAFSGGRYRVKLMLDAFNLFNTAKILSYSSGNMSSANFTVPTSIIPPRVVRFGATINF